MDKLQQAIERFNLNVLTIEDVPQSFSSAVYKIKLMDHRIVYIKIPYSKAKLEREYTVLERLCDELSVPQVLDYWKSMLSLLRIRLLYSCRNLMKEIILQGKMYPSATVINSATSVSGPSHFK